MKVKTGDRGESLPAVRVDDMDMQVMTGKLRVVTHGRGLWEIPTGSDQTAMFFPNGGEILSPGEAISIRWGGSSFGGNVRLELNRNYPSPTWETLFASTPNDGVENWSVTAPESDHVRFRIQHLSLPQQADTSNGDSRIMAADIPWYYCTGARHFHYMHTPTRLWGTWRLNNSWRPRASPRSARYQAVAAGMVSGLPASWRKVLMESSPC
jgi:hypothetical protein